MPLWIIFSVIAYFLLALNGVSDKFLLNKDIRHPSTYAFYVGITGLFTGALAVVGLLGAWLHIHFLQSEFSFQFMSPGSTVIAMIGGACFPLALYFSYKAIQQTSISRVLPIEGGLVPIFSLILAAIILHEQLSPKQIFAFLLLVFGAILISFKKKHGQWHAVGFGNAIVASFLFAVSLVLEKYAFNRVNFASGLIWTRVGFFLSSVSFLIPPGWRARILHAPKKASTPGKWVYAGARLSGALAGFLQNYAIRIGSVTLVNALQGTQYAFLLALTSLLSLKYPKVLKEHVSSQTLAQKIAAILLVSGGLILLAL